MIRAVLDTNIFVSALIFGGLPSQLVALGIERKFQMLTSPILLDELDEKLRTKFKTTPAQADKIGSDLEASCEVLSTTDHLTIIKDDPDDDRVLECAIAGRADYIISGDRHLLKLGQFEGVVVLNVRQFLDIIEPTT